MTPEEAANKVVFLADRLERRDPKRAELMVQLTAALVLRIQIAWSKAGLPHEENDLLSAAAVSFAQAAEEVGYQLGQAKVQVQFWQAVSGLMAVAFLWGLFQS